MNRMSAGLLHIIPDPLLRRLWQRHEGSIEPINPEIYKVIQNDSFSITQLLLPTRYYQQRIEKVFEGSGLTGTLLDAGCGVGNWSVAATSVFSKVEAYDPHASRIGIAEQLAHSRSVSEKINFKVHHDPALPYGDKVFDAVLCINVLTFIARPYGPFLSELRRVTKDGGRLYLIAHDRGFALFLLWQAFLNRNRDQYQMWKTVVKQHLAFRRGKAAFPQSWISMQVFKKMLEGTAWELVSASPEGDCMEGAQQSMWPKRLWGLPLMKEYVLKAV